MKNMNVLSDVFRIDTIKLQEVCPFPVSLTRRLTSRYLGGHSKIGGDQGYSGWLELLSVTDGEPFGAVVVSTLVPSFALRG
jgi:hypothetical protein